MTQTNPALTRRDRGGTISLVLGLIAFALFFVACYFSRNQPAILGGLLWPMTAAVVLLLNLAGFFLGASALVRRKGIMWALGGLATNSASALCVIGVLFVILFPRAAPGRPYTLPSGKQIRITFVGPIHFSNDQPRS